VPSTLRRKAGNAAAEQDRAVRNGGRRSHVAHGSRSRSFDGRIVMLWTLAVILVVLWVLGLVTAHTMGGFIHLLLVIAIIVVLFRVITGRRAV
jgi:hypothetical protein